MTSRPRSRGVIAMRPSPEGLESRELLSQIAIPDRVHARTATILQLPTAPMQTVSTVPANGDVNPYGVAFVPRGYAGGGGLQAGDVLVSNFNNSANLQGTGTTIVRVTPGGQQSVFYQGPPGVGLSTALGILKRGDVIVGYVPSTDGTSATVQAGGSWYSTAAARWWRISRIPRCWTAPGTWPSPIAVRRRRSSSRMCSAGR